MIRRVAIALLALTAVVLSLLIENTASADAAEGVDRWGPPAALVELD